MKMVTEIKRLRWWQAPSRDGAEAAVNMDIQKLTVQRHHQPDQKQEVCRQVFHCGKKVHKKSEYCTLKKEKERANVAGASNDQEDDEEFAFVAVCHQVSDVRIEPSYNVSYIDIINWQARVSGDNKDILNYDGDYLEISMSSLSNVSRWNDIRVVSLNDGIISESSISTYDSDNRYYALCCWDDDDESIGSANGANDDIELGELEGFCTCYVSWNGVK